MTLVLNPIEVPVFTPVSTPFAAALDKAANLMEKGWCTGYRQLAGLTPGAAHRFCALGALDEVTGGYHFSETPMTRFLADYLVGSGKFPRQDHSSNTVARWNNSSDQATVVATFREATEAARKLGV